MSTTEVPHAVDEGLADLADVPTDERLTPGQGEIVQRTVCVGDAPDLLDGQLLAPTRGIVDRVLVQAEVARRVAPRCDEEDEGLGKGAALTRREGR